MSISGQKSSRTMTKKDKLNRNSSMTDILSIDFKIKGKFESSKEKLPEYKTRLDKITQVLETAKLTIKNKRNLEEEKDKLKKNIFDIENEVEQTIYTSHTEELIIEYKNILQTPIRTSVTRIAKTETTNNNSIRKREIIQSYMDIARKYVDLPITSKKKNTDRVCDCGNRKEFYTIDHDTYVCALCYTQHQVIGSSVSFRDSDRVPFSYPYQYHRGIHFAECMRQYQAKQNTTIDPTVYSKLEAKIKENYLLVDDACTRKEKYSRVNKQHILNFLKELDLSNHNENVHLIHFKLTDVPPDDISHLEDKLIEDFKQLTEVYDKESLKPECDMLYNRKNFIMTQFVLYQLLRRHNHICNKDNFYNLSPNIEDENDDICRYLFGILNWNYSPYF